MSKELNTQPESTTTNNSSPSNIIELRHLQLEDYLGLKSAMIEAYSGIGGVYWEEEAIETLLKVFPEGQLCLTKDGKVVGCALSIIVDYTKYGDKHTYDEITGDETFKTHNPKGDVLYGIEVFVHPEHRGLRLGRRLYDARKELCESLNLKSIIAGGRIPNYQDHAHELTPREYIDKVKMREVFDPTLSFQLANGFQVRRILKNYWPEDTESREFATLLEWQNIYYQEEEDWVKQPKQVIRLGLVQWQMRNFPDFKSFCEQAEFFVDTVSDYHCDFIMFPEFFNAPLMVSANHLPESEAIRELAKYAEPIRDQFLEYAVSYNVNILTGSMPRLNKDGHLLNAGFLCRRDGSCEEYEKIHITPSERTSWGMIGGDKIKVLDTDCGKIGVIVCYDVEFPELARLLANQGMHILFVPFQTDTQNGYVRVRHCAQARAIENECYVAITGCVGNLPRINNMDINYAQSAVFTPSDFAFPTNGIKAEATPNTEMTLIVDVDLDLLKELHNHGSVQTMKDQRKDLYQLMLKKKGKAE
jgi:predicted amidohydrolase/GNAT superfamily N-acetyltransferase